MTTTDLKDFGHRELEIAGELLHAIQYGLPSDFDGNGVHVMFNMNSGYVFLTNSEFQVAMLDDNGILCSFYNTPYEGHEGSFEDLMDMYDDMHPEDQEYMDMLKEFHE